MQSTVYESDKNMGRHKIRERDALPYVFRSPFFR